jgi:hypothetical protein
MLKGTYHNLFSGAKIEIGDTIAVNMAPGEYILLEKMVGL